MTSLGRCPCLNCELNFSDDYCTQMDLADICPFIAKWALNTLTHHDTGKRIGSGYGGKNNTEKKS